MQITSGDTALVLTDPRNDFLSAEGVTWELVGAGVQENGTVEHIEQLLVAAQHPQLGDGYAAALTNVRDIAGAVLTTEQTVKKLAA